jgi:hypothetical protein
MRGAASEWSGWGEARASPCATRPVAGALLVGDGARKDCAV